MSPVLYVFRLAWPFLKELLLGGLTLREGMRSAKKKVFLLFLVSSLILAVLWLGPSFYKLSAEHVELVKSVEATNVQRLEARVKELEAMAKGEVKIPVEPLPTKPPEPLKEVLKVVKEASTEKPSKPANKKSAGNKPAPSKSEKAEVYDRKKSYMDFFDKLDN